MKRREFIATTTAGASVAGPPGSPGTGGPAAAPRGVVVERPLLGQPHAGKVLLAIQPHADAQFVEAACWIAGGAKDYPEHFAAGLEPHAVREKYYFARGPQLVNPVVDMGATIDRKVEANLANVAQGPAGRAGERMRGELAGRRLKLRVLGEDDAAANRAYVKEFVLRANRELGRQHDLEYAEAFHYVGPNALGIGYSREELDEYVRRNAVPLDSR